MDSGTIVRTIALAFAWINMLLTHNGLQPLPLVDHENIAIGLAGIVSAWTWFKNNYITLKGRQQKELLKKNKLIK